MDKSELGDRVSVGAWSDKMVICLASGPSVSQVDIEMLRAARARDSIRLITINDMYLVAPFADVAYFADLDWFRKQVAGIPRVWPWLRLEANEVRQAWASFAGQKVSITHHRDEEHYPSEVFVMKKGNAEGLSTEPDKLNTGRHSGYQVLNLAALSGGQPILLVGYDYCFAPLNSSSLYVRSKSHSHDGHHDNQPERCYWEFETYFRTIEVPLKERGISVVNCSMGSRLQRFPKRRLEDALAACA